MDSSDDEQAFDDLLIAAIEAGDLPKLKSYLDPIHVTDREMYDMSYHIFAAILRSHRPDILEYMLNYGFDIDPLDLKDIDNYQEHRQAMIKARTNTRKNVMEDFDEQFAVLKKVGAGVQGEVYLVERRLDQKLFALKRSTDSLEDEAEILRSVSGITGVPKFEDYFIINDWIYVQAILMEYVKGQPINEFFKSNPSLADRKLLATQLFDIITDLHERKIDHCDVQDRNILVSPCDKPQLYLLDYGMANPNLNEQENASDYRFAAYLCGYFLNCQMTDVVELVNTNQSISRIRESFLEYLQ